MTTVAELQARVASRYAQLDLPSWADPHEGATTPRDEEYSRVTDPGRYRIVHARARTWTAVLEEAFAVRVESLEPSVEKDADPGDFDRGVRLVPGAPGALPLVLLERDVPVPDAESTLATLDVAVIRSQVVVAREPDCGCDACDWGSDGLLSAVDQAVSRVVGGPYVVLRGSNWHAEWHPEAGSAGSDGGHRPDFHALMDLCRQLADGDDVRLPGGTEAFVGRSWFG